MSPLSMKSIVSMPFTWPGITCTRLPSSLPYDLLQREWYLGSPMRCLYSMSSPVSLLKTPEIISFGYLRCERFWAMTLCWLISRLDSIASWVHAGKYFLLLVFSAGRFSSLSVGLVASNFGRRADYTLVWLVDSPSKIPWRFMLRDSTQGERRGGADLATDGAAALVHWDSWGPPWWGYS